MIEFGEALRAAREAKGMTVAQLADATHMTVNTINELENEDFSRIPAPIYGRGFVKLYCETVGLDPKPLLAEFMDILNGNRDTEIRERPTSSTPAVAAEEPAVPEEADDPEEPAVPEEPEPQGAASSEDEPSPADLPPPPPEAEPSEPAIPEPPRAPVISQQDFFRDDPLPEAVSAIPPIQSAPLSRTSAPRPPQPASEHPQTNEPQISRYAMPIEQTRAYASPAYWRIALLGGAAVIVALLVLLGLRSLYRATTVAPEPAPAAPAAETPPPAVKAAPKEMPPAAKPAKPAEKAKPADKAKSAKPADQAKPADTTKPARTPQRIPSLYID